MSEVTTGTASGDDLTVVKEDSLPTPDGVSPTGGDNEGTVDRDFYNPHDGLKGRLKGIYLDEEERREAERHRAKLEDREPDYENMSATAGTPLVVKSALIDNSIMSNPSTQQVDAEAQPFETLPVDTTDAGTAQDLDYVEQVATEDETRGTSTTVTGTPTEVESDHPDSAANVLAEAQANLNSTQTAEQTPSDTVDGTTDGSAAATTETSGDTSTKPW